jgi:hypothetical protein
MKFEEKISGTRVTDFKITPAFDDVLKLGELIKTVKRQETMNWILDTLRFTKGENDWYAMIDYDTNYKLSILENYPEYEQEMLEYFGENWMNQYIRFNH